MRRFSRNFIAIIGSDIARRFLGMITIAYLARTISVENFGVINIGFAVLSYATILSSLGLSSLGTRTVAQGAEENIISRIVSVKLIIGSMVYLLVFLIALLFLDVQLMKMILIFCLSVFANAFFLDWYFQGKERMEIVGSARLLSAVIYIIMILIFVHTPTDIMWVAMASFSGDLIAVVIYWVYYNKYFKLEKVRFILNGWKTLLKNSIPLGLGIIISTLSVNFPIIAIGILMSNYDVGIYSAASKLVFFLLMLDRAIATILLPAASRLYTYSPNELESNLTLAIKWIIISAIPICVGGTLLSEKILSIVFGNDYLEASMTFKILIWFFLITMLHTIYTSGLIAIQKERLYGRVMSISGILYGSLILILTFFFGFTGSAIAMVLSELCTMLLMQRTLKKFMDVIFPKSLTLIIFSSLVMGIIVYLLSALNIVFLIFLGALVYIGTLFLVKAISLNEIKYLLKKI